VQSEVSFAQSLKLPGIELINNKKLITIIGIVWILFVVTEYFFVIKFSANCVSSLISCVHLQIRDYHSQYWRSFYYLIEPTLDTYGNKIYKVSPFFSIVLIVSSLWAIIVLYARRYLGIKKISISPFHIVLMFLGIELIVLLGWSGYLGVEIFPKFSQILFHILTTISEILAFVLVTVSIGKGIGALLSRQVKFNPRLPKAMLLVVSFCLGVVLISFVAYILALFEKLNLVIVLCLFAASILIFYKQVMFWLKSFFQRELKISAPTSFFDLRIMSFLLLLIFMARNFLQLSSPIPIGFDESVQYMNTVNLIAENGRLVSTTLSVAFPWELYLSTVAIIFKSISVARYITFVSGIFLLLVIYSISKLYLEKRQILLGKQSYYSFLATLIFYSLPMVMHQSSRDVKFEISSLMFALTSLYLFWTWNFSDRTKKNIYIVLLSSFFLGFAFAIRLSMSFFCLGLFLPFIYIFIKIKKPLLHKYLALILIFVFFILPIAPFVLNKTFQSQRVMLFGPVNNFSSFDKYLDNLDVRTVDKDTVSKIVNNALKEISRYSGDMSLKSKILMPLTITSGSNIQGNYVDIGFLFLALTPLLILFYFLIKKMYPKNIFLLNQLIIIFLTTYLLWLWKGRAIIWYGMAIFPVMLILFFEIINYAKSIKVYWFVINALILCWLVLVFAKTETPVLGEGDQNNLIIIPPNIEYLKNDAIAEDFLEYYHPGKSNEIKILNSHEYRQSRIYLVDSFALFFIKENDKRCYIDEYLTTYSVLNSKNDVSKTIGILKQNGFNLIVIDLYSVSNYSGSIELEKLKISLWRFLRENPDQIEILIDDQLNGIVVGKIL